MRVANTKLFIGGGDLNEIRRTLIDHWRTAGKAARVWLGDVELPIVVEIDRR
jgi:hypothetical protein